MIVPYSNPCYLLKSYYKSFEDQKSFSLLNPTRFFTTSTDNMDFKYYKDGLHDTGDYYIPNFLLHNYVQFFDKPDNHKRGSTIDDISYEKNSKYRLYRYTSTKFIDSFAYVKFKTIGQKQHITIRLVAPDYHKLYSLFNDSDNYLVIQDWKKSLSTPILFPRNKNKNFRKLIQAIIITP